MEWDVHGDLSEEWLVINGAVEEESLVIVKASC